MSKKHNNKTLINEAREAFGHAKTLFELDGALAILTEGATPEEIDSLSVEYNKRKFAIEQGSDTDVDKLVAWSERAQEYYGKIEEIDAKLEKATSAVKELKKWRKELVDKLLELIRGGAESLTDETPLFTLAALEQDEALDED